MVASLVEKVTNYDVIFITALGSPDKLIVDRVHVVERLSDLFVITVEAHSKENDISFKKVVGKPASVELTYKESETRLFCGVVGEVKQGVVDDETGFTQYTFKIYPTFWMAKFNQDYKIYQNMSASDILDEVLGENDVTLTDNKAAPKGKSTRKYCVRYGESAYDFCARLMAEEGIFYYFTMDDSGDTLVMCGDVAQLKSITPAEFKISGANVGNPWGNEVQEFYMEERVVPKKSALADYDFIQPSNKLNPKTSGEGTGGEVYRYPGRFYELSDGEDLNKIQIEQLEWRKQLFYGRSTAPDMMAGGQLMLTDHPREENNGNYNIYEVEHFIDLRPNTQVVYYNRFICFPKDIPFRPDPLPKPRIHSNQIAIVTGPSGEEIHTDEHGRIKVQFYWDQYGENDDKSSCWVRVAQMWAGSGFGAMFIPRIGMEVVVSFLDGDPDRPLVVGCVYNGDNKPPYSLPDEKTKSTIHTNTSKDGSDEYNEIRFEDKKGEEELYVRAQKDYNREVMKGDRTLIIHEGDDTKTIKKGNYTLTHEATGPAPPTHELHMIMGDRLINLDKGNDTTTLTMGDQTTTLTMGNKTVSLDNGNLSIALANGNLAIALSNGAMTLAITQGGATVTIEEGDMSTTLQKGSHTIEIQDGDETVTVKGGRTIEVGKDEMHKVKGNFTLDVSGSTVEIKADTINLTAESAMNLKGGTVSIESTSGEVSIKSAADIKGEAGANLDVKASAQGTLNLGANGMIQSSGQLAVKSDGQLTLKGSAIAIG